jgi:hypothetical protein
MCKTSIHHIQFAHIVFYSLYSILQSWDPAGRDDFGMSNLFWLIVYAFVVGHEAIFDVCTIDRVYLTPGQIDLLDDAPDRPVIYVLNHSAFKNPALQELASRERMMEDYGDDTVTVSSSNAYSHDKLRVSLRDYLLSMDEDQDRPLSSRANETFYLFGDNYGGVWSETAGAYEVASCAQCNRAGAKSVGIAGRLSGVSFHIHGPGFAEVIHGAKLWLLFPPEVSIERVPRFGPNSSMASWVEQYQAALAVRGDGGGLETGRTVDAHGEAWAGGLDWDWATMAMMQSCVMRPGELIFFPSRWLHGTLNLDSYNHFISTFIDTQLLV